MSPGTGLVTNHPMSDSTRTSADGGTSDTLNVEDLFATDDTDISIDDGESDDRATTARTEGATTGSKSTTPGTGTATPDAEDTTADELFAQLRDEHDDAEQAHAIDHVTDESPEDIMARADEDAEHVDRIDDSIRADEGALDDLLLTERREADGFLWVETETDEPAAPGGDVAALFEADSSDDDGSDASEWSDESDDFSLSDATDDSFEARAPTFDADGFGADAAAFDDDAEPDSADAEPDSATAENATESVEAAESGEEGVETAELDDSGDTESGETGDPADADDASSDGLAARIRSILTG